MDPDEKHIKSLITIYKHEIDLRDNVLKNFQVLSKRMKLYDSTRFMQFLRHISKSYDKNTILSLLYILHDLILNSKKYDPASYAVLTNLYRSYLLRSYTSFEERYLFTHLQIKNMLESLKIGTSEWCYLHWTRIKNGIHYGISKDQIEKIYDDITYLRRNNYNSLQNYRKYLLMMDNHADLKREILRYLISD